MKDEDDVAFGKLSEGENGRGVLSVTLLFNLVNVAVILLAG